MSDNILNQSYNRNSLTDFLFEDYIKDEKPITLDNTTNTVFKVVVQLGHSENCELTIYEAVIDDSIKHRRTDITQAMFRVMESNKTYNALIVFLTKASYKLSFIAISEGEFSNPHRFTYALGPCVNTDLAYNQLIIKGKIKSLEDLSSRFAVDTIQTQFYSDLKQMYTRLVGGKHNKITYESELKTKANSVEFSIRLLTRMLFCHFLTLGNTPLITPELISIKAVDNNPDYYNFVLKPLFFAVLNTPVPRRYNYASFNKVPFINESLFGPYEDDAEIKDQWFKDLYQLLNSYNFITDENTANDIDIAIDPEMMGIVFESLLAEVTTETKESARKATGAFYTPKAIVSFMVDDVLVKHFNTKTSIDEDKLNAIIDYSKNKREYEIIQNLTTKERQAIVDTICCNTTILDPACGAGAFPMGMLLKLVYILQEVDPDGHMLVEKICQTDHSLIGLAMQKWKQGLVDYLRKLIVIKRCLYCVDIQPLAVSLSKLRFYLSLIISDEVSDKLENRGITRLPNLDSNMVVSNALVYPPQEVSNE
jgi:hypothetical protein